MAPNTGHPFLEKAGHYTLLENCSAVASRDDSLGETYVQHLLLSMILLFSNEHKHSKGYSHHAFVPDRFSTSQQATLQTRGISFQVSSMRICRALDG